VGDSRRHLRASHRVTSRATKEGGDANEHRSTIIT
jgi:hypothetical protein